MCVKTSEFHANLRSRIFQEKRTKKVKTKNKKLFFLRTQEFFKHNFPGLSFFVHFYFNPSPDLKSA